MQLFKKLHITVYSKNETLNKMLSALQKTRIGQSIKSSSTVRGVCHAQKLPNAMQSTFLPLSFDLHQI